ncbi:vitamin B12-dependent ribonucleotide reductase [Geomonas sp. Red69]|uniref:Vitamin B12-dependent ribonucleotide reductase n=1 Tax=Geomonas diazotrophica TaxID=2843197 RepID=A0ABX8JDK4_9BACT|nr:MULTISPECIES: vitamin B12-dependent ribonucleotide reductase [Geomonas]MBU5638900.1 vitamin B12-dependent ribonucleotide reductase [Geomonas diazotrophica]QWV96378.1 vitamin B12-dependent ribonucleotide reductase [Geomonas nitrogeniifigens]QXE85445.1 vitamin B12-dependent ribonucleotide reductase [Geomonas nitrogeniifigens]
MKKTVEKGQIPGLTKNALTVLEKRYLKRDQTGKPLETASDMFRRVATAIAQADTVFDKKADISALSDRFYSMMTNFEFLPNSPTLMNAGRELGQLSACFVLPVGDSMEEIFESVKYTALIHKSGGGTGFSFSRLRPANDVVMSTTGISSGPLSFMRVFDVATETIKQGGTRRGANMAILRVDHPDIMDFIMCKNDQRQLNNFNISVGITEEFMKAVDADKDYTLMNPRDKKPAGSLNARKVFARIVKQAWENGEPGIIFLDRLNKDNPTPHIGEIESTNPCGEQPLLPYESCNLGSINLGKFVVHGKVNWDKLKETVRTAVHFLDNVIEVNNYPLPQIDEMTRSNRKIGLGVMGWADMLIMLGIPYGSEESVELGEKVMQFINEEGKIASRELAKTRGPFPNFKGSVYDVPGGDPIRNATVTTIAPTGTISIIANASSGVEPLFAVSFVRQVMDKNILVEVNPLFEKVAKEQGFYSEELMQRIAEHGTVHDISAIPEDVRDVFVTAHDISPEEHITMQAAFQRHTDNAVSKTVNFPREATIEDVEEVYRLAYQMNCKGVTIYRDGSRDEQVLSVGKKEEPKAAVPLTAEEKRSIKRERPKALKGWTYQMQTGCGPLYITINEDASGLFEVFTTMGKAGGCAASQSEAIGRMVSLAWRSGVQARQVVKQLLGISCHSPSGFGDNKVLSCADAVAKAIQSHLALTGHAEVIEAPAFERGACPECGGVVEHEGGCAVCRVCGYSECA